MGSSAAAAGDDDAAAVALDALAALSAAKRIAAAALYVQAMRPLDREAALACAARVYGVRLGPTRGGLKKAVSEGRAILQFGLPSLDGVARLPSADMLRALETAVRRVSLREVTRARATALAGGRGGRPMARPPAAYSAVRKLLDLARAGDADARAELAAIQELIRSDPSGPAHGAGHPAASR